MSDTPRPSRSQDRDVLDVPLCPNCLAANSVDQHFCVKCNAPLTSHAAIDPLGQVFAAGHVYRTAASRPSSWIVLIGMWLLFGNSLLVNLGAVWYCFLALTDPVLQWNGTSYCNPFFLVYGFLLALGTELLFAAILVKVTLNYRRQKKVN